MRVNEIKHQVKLAEWKRRIIECRSSGKGVMEWCREKGTPGLHTTDGRGRYLDEHPGQTHRRTSQGPCRPCIWNWRSWQ